MITYAFIGCGNMAKAIFGGITNINSTFHVKEENIVVFDTDPTKYSAFSKSRIASNEAEAVAAADRIILAVKPQNYKDVLSSLGSVENLEQKVFISIAAGITTDKVCQWLGKNVPVIRTMPNTPLFIGMGVTALCHNTLVSNEAFQETIRLFGAVGHTLILPESQMNAIISVTSSSPAYVYLFIKAITDAAIEMGFDQNDALKAVCEMVKGSAQMVLESGKTPSELIKMVTSPQGTTERAMNVFYENHFEDIVSQAMDECTKRAEELSNL